MGCVPSQKKKEPQENKCEVLPITSRQKFLIVSSWKGVSRALETTGVNMFIK